MLTRAAGPSQVGGVGSMTLPKCRRGWHVARY